MSDKLSVTEIAQALEASKTANITVTSDGTIKPKWEERPRWEDKPRETGLRVEVRRMDNKESQMFEIDRCLRKLKKRCEKEGIISTLRDRQHYRKPSEIRREKAKVARRLAERRKKKQDERDALYENTKFVPAKRFDERGVRINDNRRNFQKT
jgi:small subunit ribosomal protein S21